MADREPFGIATFITPEAVGQPGQRRFRIKAMNEDGRTVSLWLEKEQLSALGDAIETVLKGEGYDLGPTRPAEEPVFPWKCDIDFRIGQLSLGLHRNERMIVLSAAEITEEQTAPTNSVAVAIDYGQSTALSDDIVKVVAAGRAPCALCGGPLDPAGHVCPRQNGHSKG